MVKRYLLLFGISFLFIHLTQVVVHSETGSVEKGMYATTEDILLDILLPIVDKRVIEEYEQNTPNRWNWIRIEDITYNANHSYDITVKMQIILKNDVSKEDTIKVRVSPSCDSVSSNKQICNHAFKMEVLDYQHVSP